MSKQVLPHPEPGLYVLTKDIKNPAGDKRCVHSYWRRPVWCAGDQLVVEPFEAATNAYVLRCVSRQTAYESLLFVEKNRAYIDALVPHLVRFQATTLSDILLEAKHVHHINAERILSQLLDRRVLTLDDVRKAVGQLRKGKCKHE